MSFDRSTLVALSVLTVTQTLSCAALTGEDSGTAEQETKIKPQDNEVLGELIVDEPTGWTLPQQIERPPVTYESSAKGRQTLTLGTPLRTNASTGCVEVDLGFREATKVCGVEVKKKKITTVKLGALKATADEKLLAIDFGPAPSFKIHHTQGGTGGNAKEYEIYEHAQQSRIFALWTVGALAAPGQYRFAWNLPVLGEVKQALARDAIAQVDLVPKDVRGTITIKPPSARELPNAPTHACQTKDRTFIFQRSGDESGEPLPFDQRLYQVDPKAFPNGHAPKPSEAWRALPVTGITSLKVFPFTAAEAPMRYELVVNSLTEKLDVKPGKTVTVQLERLDVDDVEVEREDGSKYDEQGIWKVWRKDANGSWQPLTSGYGQNGDCSGQQRIAQAEFPTGYGIDVLPGDYRIQVDYQTGEGVKTKNFTVSVP